METVVDAEEEPVVDDVFDLGVAGAVADVVAEVVVVVVVVVMGQRLVVVLGQ